MRLIRTVGLFSAGALAGAVGTAAFVRRALPSRGDAASDEVALVAILNGIDLRSRATAFRGGSMLAWLGGIAVDLREATPTPEMHLTTTALLGGIAVRLPPGWRVETSILTLGGGVDVDAPEPEDPAAPRLVLDGFALLGGIAVKGGEADLVED
jgi:hypothetical protein